VPKVNVDLLAHLECTKMITPECVTIVTLLVPTVLVHTNGNVFHSVEIDSIFPDIVLKIVDYITIKTMSIILVLHVVELVKLVTDQDVMVIVILVLMVTTYIMDNV
jgi:hypothetical protein